MIGWLPLGRKGPKMHKTTAKIHLNILGYKEDGEHVALALEMDLRGYGATIDAALAELQDLVLAQISFALFKGHPETIWFRAEQRYWDLLRTARADLLARSIARLGSGSIATIAGLDDASSAQPTLMDLPEPHVIDERLTYLRDHAATS